MIASDQILCQDLGNTNFAIILPRLLFTRAHGAELVARAIRERLGVEGCRVNKRNDVVMRDGENDYKVGHIRDFPSRAVELMGKSGLWIRVQDHSA